MPKKKIIKKIPPKIKEVKEEKEESELEGEVKESEEDSFKGFISSRKDHREAGCY